MRLIELPSGDIVDAEAIMYVKLRELEKGTYPGGYEYEYPPAVFIRLVVDPPGSGPSLRFEFATNEEARAFREKVRGLLLGG